MTLPQLPFHPNVERETMLITGPTKRDTITIVP